MLVLNQIFFTCQLARDANSSWQVLTNSSQPGYFLVIMLPQMAVNCIMLKGSGQAMKVLIITT